MPRVPSSLIKDYRTALRDFVVTFRTRVKLIIDTYGDILSIRSIDAFNKELLSAVHFVTNRAKLKSKAIITNLVQNAEFHAKRELKRVYGKDAEFFTPIPNDVLLFAEKSYDEEIEHMGIDLQENIKRTVRAGVMDGLSIQQITTMLHAVYKTGWSNAERIARTETARMWSIIMEERYKQMGVIEFEWITSGDARVCKICKPLNGKKFKLGANIKLNNGKTVNIIKV